MDIEKINSVRSVELAKRQESSLTVNGIDELLHVKAIIEKTISDLTDLKTKGGFVEIRIKPDDVSFTVKEMFVDIKPDDVSFIDDLIALEVEHLVALDIPAAEFEALAKTPEPV